MGGIRAADIFPRQANMSVSLAHTAIRIFYLFPSRPITALNTGRVSLTNTGLGLARCLLFMAASRPVMFWCMAWCFCLLGDSEPVRSFVQIWLTVGPVVTALHLTVSRAIPLLSLPNSQWGNKSSACMECGLRINQSYHSRKPRCTFLRFARSEQHGFCNSKPPSPVDASR